MEGQIPLEPRAQGEFRSRTDSGASKRRRGEEGEITAEREDIHVLKKCLNEYLTTQCTRISREQAGGITDIFNKMEQLVYEEMERRATAEGVLKGYQMAVAMRGPEETQQRPGPLSYREVAKIPKVGRKAVEQRDPERVVLFYPTDENQTDAEQTKKLLKETLAPREEKLQIRSVRKVTKGGVVVEAGNKSGAIKIKEIARRVPSLKITEPKKLNPRVLIYDVDRDMEEDDVIRCIYQQNLEDHGVTMNEMNKGFRICYRTGRRDNDVVNLVVEVDAKIREILLEAGRVYIDFAACRVVDQLAVTRCFRCQGYGHVKKVCKKAPGDSVCSHCGRAGHEYKECRRSEEKPSCANCLAARKPADHRVGTLDCPMYKRLVQQKISRTSY